MKKEIIQSLVQNFEDYANMTKSGVEFWLARDLQHLLGYTKWSNFFKVLNRAKTACEVSKNTIDDHFPELGKMVTLGSGSQREVQDFILTRYACYLIAQNGDPKKEAIAFAQNYFAIQTRKFEMIEQRIKDWERLQARTKLSLSEKELSELIYEKTGNEKDFGMIKSKGDNALFGGNTTQKMKIRLGIPTNRPLADFYQPLPLKPKTLLQK